MNRTTGTTVLSLIYLGITLSLLINAFLAMWHGQPDNGFISLLGMVAMAVITDKVNERNRIRMEQTEEELDNG